MYKIGVIGTFGVGKTTFLHRLFSELKYRAFQVEMVPELSRLCPYDINESGEVSRGQYWIFKEQIKLELDKAELLPDFLLCDRSVFDNSLFAFRGAEEGYVDPATYRMIEEGAGYWRKSYFLLIYISLEDHLRLSRNRGMEDGVRSTNEKFQLEIEELISRAWDKIDGNKLKIEGSLDRRMEMTMDYLHRKIDDDRLRLRNLEL